MIDQSGQTIKGYELAERIGSGGFGAVYRAFQSTLGREVAVKIILPGYANQPEFIRRFEVEAQLVARLEHLHIVPLYDYWRDPEGAYLVMRWLRGGSVKDVLAESPYNLGAASLLLDQVSAGLATAHTQNIIHRDIKPSNILLDEEGNAYLADFGIAKDLSQKNGLTNRSEAIIGSPDYLSPEQARSQPVTPQTDIYSLGVTLYEIITGQHPFPELTAVERLFKHINDPLPLLDSLDPVVQADINDVLQRATAKNPKHRYRDVLEMAAEFRQAAKLGEDGRTALVEALTLREQEILQLITEGKSNREIAEALFIELTTVKWYNRQIYKKLEVRNRRQAIVRARDLNLLVMADEEVFGEGSSAISLALPAPVNPYKGLRPFETADADDYYGRETLIKKLLANFAPAADYPTAPSVQNRFLAIVGPSGSGKSSLVQAGLIPALARGDLPGSERWFVVQMTPGARPFDELEVALIRIAANQASSLREQLERDENGLLRAADIILPQDGSELVLVIDQFEELFTLTVDETVRQHFLDVLAAAVTDDRSRLRLVITLRADYYDRPLHYPRFGDLMRSHMETVLPLSAAALEEAVVKPAKQVGVECEPGLAAVISDDVLYQPGGLPLLQYALTELFEQRDGRTLTRQAYEAIGGVTGALANRAEALYQEQDEVGREAIRQMFLRLVALDEGQETLPDTRRRVPRTELTAITNDEDVIEEIIDTFGSFRLLTMDHDPVNRRPTVEVAHEALLREWERLRQWLEDSLDDLYQHRRLQMLAQEWLANGRDAGYLLHKTRLDQFSAWVAQTDLALTHDEQAFLDASLDARQDRRAEEQARQKRELETAQRLAETERRRAEEQTAAAQRLRRRAVYLGTALVFAALLALVAAFAGWQAAQNAETAQTNADLAATNEARALSNAELASSREAEAAANADLAATREQEALENANLAAFQQATAVAEANQRATAEAVAVRERESAEAQARLASARELSLAALGNRTIDPELSLLLAIQAVKETYEEDGFALPEAESALHHALWNLRQEQTMPGSSAAFCSQNVWCGDVVYSEDGSFLAASGPENTAVIWETASGKRLLAVDGHSAAVVAVALAPAGDKLATAGADGLAMVWDLSKMGETAVLSQPLLILSGHTAELTDVAFSPEGSRIATSSRDNTIRLWDGESGQEIGLFSGHEGSVRDVAFNAAGTELFSASSDSTIIIWDIAAQQERLTLAGHSDRVADLALSSDGSQLATAGWDSQIRIWDVVTGEELLAFPGDQSRVFAVAFSPDGSLLAGGGTDAVINVWDAETGEEVLDLAGHKGPVHNLAFHPDGSQLASGAGDGTIRTWNISRAGSREWLTLNGHRWIMFGVDFSPDGSTLASASWDGAVKLWDVETGMDLRTIVADEWRKMSVAFSPDGTRIATTAENDTAVVWEVATGEAVQTFTGHDGPILDAAFSPDGRQLVTAGESGEMPGLINVWNIDSGELALSWVGHEGSIERVAVNPDGDLLATASTDGTAKLWRLASGELVAVLSAHEANVNGINFSHDGRYLATAGADNTARIWDLDDEDVRQTAVMQGHSSVVWDAVFSPDDATLATISFDGAVKLWDVATSTEKLTLPGEGREVAFSPDGTYLAITESSGLIRLYVLPVEDLLALAELRLSRPFTEAECQQYLHQTGCAP